MPLPNKLGKPTFTGAEDPAFWQHYNQLVDTVNTLAGHNGDVELASHLNLGGNRIKNVGPPVHPSDALSSAAAQSRYSPAVLRPQFESGGKFAFVGYRQINNKTQREVQSSFLNGLLSTPPNANNINPLTSTSGGITTVTIPASLYRFGDGTTWYLPSRTDTLTNPASYTISSWSVTGGVATVNLTTSPSPPFTAATVVYVSGTSVIDGTWSIATILGPSSFTFNGATGTSGVGGTVSAGGTYYYYLSRKFRKVLLATLPSSSDTPFSRLTVSADSLQLLAVIRIKSDGTVAEGTAGGGTPTSTANAGSRF